MRLLLFSPLTFVLGLMACGNAATDTAGQPGQATQQAANASGNPAAAPASYQESGQTPPPAKGPYRLLGITDPDFNNMVAFALKVPTGWQTQQSFRREWDGPTPHIKVNVGFRSPDGTQQVEYLPLREYAFAEGPSQQQARQMEQQTGMPHLGLPNELAPMSALEYLRSRLLPELARQGMALRNVGNPREAAPHAAAKSPDPGRRESSASLDGVLPNGHQARVEVRLGMSQMDAGNGDTFYGWSVVPSVTQTSGNNLAATYAHTKIAQESIVSNPAWLKKNGELQQQGQQASRQQHEARMQQSEQFGQQMTAGHNQRMANIAEQGAANTARHNERMGNMDQQMADYKAADASRDRQHEAYVDNAINNETKYADPSTGQRVKLDNRYNHSYSDGKGTYYQSNTPIEPGNVNWQELQQVSRSDY